MGLAGLPGADLAAFSAASSTASLPSFVGGGSLGAGPGLGNVSGLTSIGAAAVGGSGAKLGGELRNPLDRMSEIAKGGSSTSTSTTSASGMRPSLGPRHSAWQSQWISRGPESNKDIFKCVWCKDSFSSLQSLTVHMKETKHFGGNIPASPQMPPRSPLVSPSTTSAQKSGGGLAMSPSVTPPAQLPPLGGANQSPNNKSSARDILKEQLPMPRKLVRGQDVWLGRGEQQTKDILKCMWCGQSFRTLDLMTKHMQETKHYTKVISQEQLVSWKSPDSQGASQNHVNQVLTCKVCDQAFSSLKELSDHMVKNNHYKETGRGVPPGLPGAPVDTASVAMGRNSGGTTPTGIRGGPSPAAVATAASLNNQAKEKRKKSLPVRKLLELERAQQELTGLVKADETTGRIACEKCGEKIPMHIFVDHIRQCVGPLMPLQAAAMAAARSGLPPTTSTSDFLAAVTSGRLLSTAASTPPTSAGIRRTPSVSPPRKSPVTSTSSLFGSNISGTSLSKKILSPQSNSTGTDADEPKSILGSLEQMVQNNFGAKKRQPGPETNMSILQRLGIDEGVDYSKPLLDPMAAMGAMFRPPPGSSLASLAGFLPPQSYSTSTRSNSSECSSPDRFKNERPASIKSDSSIKSPPLEDVQRNAKPIQGKSVSPLSTTNTKDNVEDDNDDDDDDNDIDGNISANSFSENSKIGGQSKRDDKYGASDDDGELTGPMKHHKSKEDTTYENEFKSYENELKSY